MGKTPPRGKAAGPRDWHLWSAVARTVTPLRPGPPEPKKTATLIEELEAALNPAPPAPPPAPRHKAPPLRGIAPLGAGRSPKKPVPAPTLEPRITRRLARGRLPIDATLDLHGMTQDQARGALERFIGRARARDVRTILVITGKGLKKTGYLQIEQKGVLRHMLPLWLADPALASQVAGYETAHQSHGGEGAYYVRLKRGARAGRP